MDIYKVRVRHLKSIVDLEYGGNQTKFAKAVGLPPPRVNRWLSNTAGETRNISEASARKIEVALGKPLGWMDSSDNPDTVAELSAIYNSLDENMKKLMLDQARAFVKLSKSTSSK